MAVNRPQGPVQFPMTGRMLPIVESRRPSVKRATEHMIRWILVAVCAAQTMSCATMTVDVRGEDPRLAAEARAVLDSGRVFARTMGSSELFEAYAVQVHAERYVRFVIDLRTRTVTFFDANVYPLHVDFVFAEIYREEITPERLTDFMANYDQDKPEFIFGYLVHHMAPDFWTWAHWEGDQVGAAHVELTYELLKETFFRGDVLHFRPETEGHQAAATAAGSVPVKTNDEIYEAVTYQRFNEGERVGRLIIVREPKRAMTATPDEILVLSTAVPDLSVVAGIVSETFSTPLSHVALRARAWGVPHIGQKHAGEIYAHLEGKVVYYLLERGADPRTCGS